MLPSGYRRVLTFHTPVAVAAATLVAAALFNPLRRRVQLRVDRRFNRERYDADQTMTAFAARLKDAVDLDSVRDDLAALVHDALEPAHLSMWIDDRPGRPWRQGRPSSSGGGQSAGSSAWPKGVLQFSDGRWQGGETGNPVRQNVVDPGFQQVRRPGRRPEDIAKEDGWRDGHRGRTAVG
jgi:hypothetical protein